MSASLRMLLAVLVVGAVGIVAPIARADVVSAQGRPLVVDVKITALKDGQLCYQSEGSQITRPIEQIRYLQITGWDAFNQAERQQRDGHTKLAIAAYEKILEEGPAAGQTNAIDRRLLVQCRLVRLYDAQGQFDAAVAAYLAAVRGMPAVVESLRPTHVPKSGPELTRAAELVEKAVAERDRLDPIGTSLEQWRNTWPDLTSGTASRPGNRPATGNSRAKTGTATRPADASEGSASIVDEARRLVESGRYEAALERLAAAAKTTPDPALYYWQGQAYLGLAGKAKEQDAKAQRRRAGAAFMRVAILSPACPLAAECLFRAGQICRDEGRADRAAALWAELIGAYPTAAQWTQQARQELAKLKTTATGPAK